ncbi:MAG: hypothetical protein R2851_20515 [Caldilineaceae bacterium]
MAKGKKQARRADRWQAQGRSLGSILGETGYLWPSIALVLIAAGVFFWWIMRSADGNTPVTTDVTAPPEGASMATTEPPLTPTPRAFAFGRANACQAGPRFGPQFGFQPGSALIGTSVRATSASCSLTRRLAGSNSP